MTIRLNHDFKEFLRLLEDNKVVYLLVGGYAVGYYGHVRPTGDIDIWVSRENENAIKIVSVLSEFGFDSPELTAELFTLAKSIVRMGIPPFKVEIITSIDGVEFRECYERRATATIGGIEISVIGLSDLITNKRASGRPKDLSDLIELERLSR